MTGLVQAMKAKLNERCLVSKLNKHGCSLPLTGLPRRRIAIDLDSPFAPVDDTATRCDYLFLVEDETGATFAAPIELKKGAFGATSVAGQLQAGADALAKLLPERSVVRFHALVASGRFPKSERDRFKRRTVTFRGSSHPLLHTTCGSQLRSALCT